MPTCFPQEVSRSIVEYFLVLVLHLICAKKRSQRSEASWTSPLINVIVLLDIRGKGEGSVYHGLQGKRVCTLMI